MKHLFFMYFLFVSLSLSALPDSLFVQEIHDLRQAKEYEQIIQKLDSGLTVIPHDVWLLYQRACYASLTGDQEKAFACLHQSVRLHQEARHIFTDTDFDALHETKEWKALEDTLTVRYLRRYPGITHPELSAVLWRMGIEDQRFRSLRANYKHPYPEPGTSDYEVFQKQDRKDHQKRTKRVLRILRKHDWPTYTMVGREASDAAFFVIQHSDSESMAKAIGKMKVAVNSSEASKHLYAMMYDRLLTWSNKKQIYGTQLYSFTGEIEGKKYDTGLFLYPVKDEKNLNQRREEMGLKPIEEYLQQWNLEYQYNPEFEIMSATEIVEYYKREGILKED